MRMMMSGRRGFLGALAALVGLKSAPAHPLANHPLRKYIYTSGNGNPYFKRPASWGPESEYAFTVRDWPVVK